jgi:N-acetylmuramoyl-L-alanine amidase
MPASAKSLSLFFALIALAVGIFFLGQPRPKPLPPEWNSLEIYQRTITRSEFETLLNTVFTTGSAWHDVITLSETKATIRVGNSAADGHFHLHFSATDSSAAPSPRPWRSTRELPPPSREQPLNGLKIAIDPGHIGGVWAIMEERWLRFGGGSPVMEGDMTLQVAQLLKPLLEDLGASVSLVRSNNEPVTQLRPTGPGREAERQFYRTAEIHARAKLVNETLKPDLVLCLHFNAEAWGDPTQPALVDRTHLHLILNGAYTDEELVLPDQRLAMLKKLLSRTHEEEILVGSQLATTFSEITGLPPYQYPADTKNALPIPNQPYLWTRNLLANRLYDCPVIYLEPYVMNSSIDYPRLQAGDYEGLRNINGKPQISIFREYANALAQGLIVHNLKQRTF